MFLAAADLQTVPSDLLKNLLIIGLAISSPIIALYASRRRTRIEPDPLRVQAVENLVTKPECERLHRETQAGMTAVKETEDKVHDQLFAKINAVDRRHAENLSMMRAEMHGMELRMNTTAEERTAKVHERVNEILAAENETRGTLHEVSNQFAGFGQLDHYLRQPFVSPRVFDLGDGCSDG
jgi:hypothetical protein